MSTGLDVRKPLRPRGRARWLVASAACLLPAWSVACSGEPETPVAASDLQELNADVAIYGMRQNITVDGIREAQLYADTAYTYRDSTTIDVRALRLTLYTETGAERAFVTAARGFIDTNNQSMTARGNVVLTIPEQARRIESEELFYDPNRDRIWSDTFTVMIHQGQRSTGESFESDLGFTTVKIFGARGRSGSGAP